VEAEPLKFECQPGLTVIRQISAQDAAWRGPLVKPFRIQQPHAVRFPPAVDVIFCNHINPESDIITLRTSGGTS
jgi:hypothetical protein